MTPRQKQDSQITKDPSSHHQMGAPLVGLEPIYSAGPSRPRRDKSARGQREAIMGPYCPVCSGSHTPPPRRGWATEVGRQGRAQYRAAIQPVRSPSGLPLTGPGSHPSPYQPPRGKCGAPTHWSAWDRELMKPCVPSSRFRRGFRLPLESLCCRVGHTSAFVHRNEDALGRW